VICPFSVDLELSPRKVGASEEEPASQALQQGGTHVVDRPRTISRHQEPDVVAADVEVEEQAGEGDREREGERNGPDK
jgi:hypothetical protein